MAFDAGAVVGRLELGLAGWKKSVETIKADQQSLSGFAIRHKEEIQKLGQAMTVAGGAIVAVLGAMAQKTIGYGDELDTLRQKTGISAETLSSYKLAVDQAGMTLGDFALSLKLLANNMQLAVDSESAAGKAFASIGVSVKDAAGNMRPMNDVLMDVADRFAAMPDGATKSALAVDIFGRSGTQMIHMLNLGSAGLKETMERARALGVVMTDEAAEACDKLSGKQQELKLAVQGVGIQIGTILMPAIQAMTRGITEALIKFREFAKEHPALSEGVVGLAAGMGTLMLGVGPLLAGLPSLAKGLTMVTAATGLSAGAIGGAAFVVMASVGAWAKLASIIWDTVAAEKYAIGAGNRLAESENKLVEDLSAAAVAAGWQYGRMSELIKAYDGNISALAMAIEKGREGTDIQRAFTEAVRNHNDRIEEQKKKTGELIPTLGSVTEKVKTLTEELGLLFLSDLRDRTDKITKALELYKGKLAPEKEKELREELAKLQKQLALSASGGFDVVRGSLADMKVDLSDVKTITISLVKPFSNIEEAMESFALKTGYSGETLRMFLYEMVRLKMLAAGLTMPDLKMGEIPDPRPKVKSMAESMRDAWAQAMTDIARGWSEAFVKMFGLVDALVGHATKHNQAFFDQCYSDLQRDLDAYKTSYDEKMDALNEFYSNALDEVNAYYEGVREAERESYDDARDALGEETDAKLKTMRREYEDKRDYIMATVRDSAERDAMLKQLDRDYEDSVDAVKRQEKEKLKILEDDYQAKLKEIKNQELAKEKEIAAQKKAEEEKLKADLKAIEDKYQVDIAKIKADEEKSRQEHADNEERRQSSLWGKVKGIFGKAVEDMAAAWLTGVVSKILASITESILPAISGIGTAATTTATTAGGVLGGLATSVGTIITGLATAISTGIVTLATGIASVITILATAIATAATTLAAAAPALLELGLIAAAIYTAFKLGEALVGAIGSIIGGGGQTDVTYWLKMIKDNGQILTDHFVVFYNWALGELWPVAYAARDLIGDCKNLLAGIQGSLWNIESYTAGTLAALTTIPAAATGAFVSSPTLAMVGEAGPEYIIPQSEFPRWPNAPTEAGRAPASPMTMTVNITGPLIQTSGVSDADLRRAGEKFMKIIDGQLRRAGMRGYAHA